MRLFSNLLCLLLVLAFNQAFAEVPKSGTSVMRLNDLGVATSVREIRKQIDQVDLEISSVDSQIEEAELGRTQFLATQGVNSLNVSMFESLKSQLEFRRQTLTAKKTELNLELTKFDL